MSVFLFGILVVLLLLQLLFLGVLASFAVTLFFGSPWVPTAHARAKRMLTFAGLQPEESLLDLGSGDGAILFAAAEDFSARVAVGFEINPILVLRARLRARLRGCSDRVHTFRRNMFTTTLPDVAVVCTFLIPSTMKRLRQKLGTELAPDTRIVSRGFAIPGVTPRKKHEGPGEWLYLYRAGDLREDRG